MEQSTSLPAQFVLKPSEASTVLLRSLQRFYAEKKLFDVSISCNDRTLFGCHKIVLASCSSYFETLLSTTDGFAILNLDAVDAKYVQYLNTIVNFMYGHNVVVSKSGSSCKQLYEAARIFGATALIKSLDVQMNSSYSKASTKKVPKRSYKSLNSDEVIVLKPSGIGSMLLVNFQRFKNNEKFIDAKICCRDEVLFTCHKLVLASFSAYFETLLSNTEGSAILNLDAVDSLYVQQLSTLISYMYGKTMWVNTKDLDQLQDAAHVFGVQSLEKGDLEKIRQVNERSRMKKSLEGKLDRLRNEQSTSADNYDHGHKVQMLQQGLVSNENLSVQRCDPHAGSSGTVPLSSIGAVEEITSHMDECIAESSDAPDAQLDAQLDHQSDPTSVQPGNISINKTIKNYMVSIRGALPTFDLCQKCGRTFRQRSSLRSHLQKHQISDSPSPTTRCGVKCAECPSTFKDVSSLRSHWESLHGLNHERPGCFHCGLVFCSKLALRSHAVSCRKPTVDGNRSKGDTEMRKKLLCKACGHTSFSVEAFLVHVDTEHVTNDFVCHVCNYAFPDRHSLNDHFGKEHDVPMHSCQICGKSFKTLPGFKYHMDTHKESQRCWICPFSTTTRKNLLLHIKKYHPSISMPSDRQTAKGTGTETGMGTGTGTGIGAGTRTETGVGTGTGTGTGMGMGTGIVTGTGAGTRTETEMGSGTGMGTGTGTGTRTRMEMGTAMETGTGMETTATMAAASSSTATPTTTLAMTSTRTMATTVTTSSTSTSMAATTMASTKLDHLPHKCSECPAAFMYECLLIRHYHKRHMKLKPFKCPYCGHATTEKAALQTHIRCVHTKEAPFTCEICGFKGRTSSIMNRHRRVHTGDKPHVCQQCDAAFPEKRDLTTHHWKVHAKERPYSCSLCNVGFLRKDNLLQHQRSKHGITSI